jgi:4-amino-4-deoxy-L-arabinose transferase-like glycosyltransferase
VLSGKTLFVEPSIDFVPAIYTPLYTYLSSWIAKVIGLGFTPLRLVSAVSILCSLLLIFGFVFKETRNKTLGILSAGLFAATFRAGGAFFDVARVDMLFITLILGAICLVKYRESWSGWAFAGLFLSLAFLTKQSALLVAGPIFLYALFIDWRKALGLIAVFTVIVISFTIYWNIISDGWYLYYTWELPKGHELVKLYPITFISKDLMGILPVACGAGLFLLLTLWGSKDHKRFWFYFFVTAGMMMAALAPRMKVGGYDNCLIPTFAILAILFGVGLNSIFERINTKQSQPSLSLYIWLLCLLQFGMLFYRPDHQLPTKADRIAGEQFINSIEKINGNVFIPFHGYYAAIAGKHTFAHSMAIADVYRGKNEAAKKALTKSFEQAVESGELSAVIMDTPTPHISGWGEEKIAEYFEADEMLMKQNNFWPVTGMQTRPETLLRRKQTETE